MGGGGSIGKTIGRAGLAGITGGISEFGQSNPFGVPGNPLHAPINNAAKSLGFNLFGDPLGNTTNNPYVQGPFGLDPAQMAKDKADITGLGNKQYSDTLGAIDTNTAAQTQHAKDMFGQMLPNIAENSQAAHLYDSTGYGQEVARQQSGIASQVASDAAQQKMQALTGRQGFETGALQRGQSLEDFINQANVAKSLGAQMAPPPPSGKQNFGTVAQGVGALSPWGKLAKGAGGGASGAPPTGMI